MSDPSNRQTRKQALQGLIVLPAMAALFASGTAIAQAKGSKAQFKYQDHPHGSAKCSGCKFFTPGKSAKAMGLCKLVAGPISPNGWCIAYSPKG
jgi:hypothetical protein